MKYKNANKSIIIPEGFIVFISGVPGSGKTTISYELLRSFNEFRLIQETDLMREILRGYNDYLKFELGENTHYTIRSIDICDNLKFLSYDEASIQCKHMKNSLLKIIDRQQRKGISTIINGVHVIPEVLCELALNKNVIFVNLFISNEIEFNNRFKLRNENKYTLKNIQYIFNANIELHFKTNSIKATANYAINSIDVTSLSINETLKKVIECIEKRVSSFS